MVGFLVLHSIYNHYGGQWLLPYTNGTQGILECHMVNATIADQRRDVDPPLRAKFSSYSLGVQVATMLESL